MSVYRPKIFDFFQALHLNTLIQASKIEITKCLDSASTIYGDYTNQPINQQLIWITNGWIHSIIVINKIRFEKNVVHGNIEKVQEDIKQLYCFNSWFPISFNKLIEIDESKFYKNHEFEKGRLNWKYWYIFDYSCIQQIVYHKSE